VIRMKQFIAISIAALSLAGSNLPASAADMPAYRPPLVTPQPTIDWTGFYVGIGVGGRWTETNWTTTCLQAAGGGCPGNALFATRFGVDDPSSFDMSGFRVGGYLGYNWQFANWVVGIEGDAAWADIRNNHTGIPGTHLAAFTAIDSASVRTQWDASIRGRLGYLFMPQALIYVTGGGTWLETEVSAVCAAGSFALGGWCSLANTFTASRTLFGWTVGGGIDWMFAPGWIGRAEYRFSDFSNGGQTFAAFTANPIDAFNFTVDHQTHTGTIGISYLFNFAPGGFRY